MRGQQKAIIVKTGPEETRSLEELNHLLRQGWRVAEVAPMGGAGVGAQDGSPALCLAALVILERAADTAAEAIMEAEEEVEELLDELGEGNGTPI